MLESEQNISLCVTVAKTLLQYQLYVTWLIIATLHKSFSSAVHWTATLLSVCILYDASTVNQLQRSAYSHSIRSHATTQTTVIHWRPASRTNKQVDCQDMVYSPVSSSSSKQQRAKCREAVFNMTCTTSERQQQQLQRYRRQWWWWYYFTLQQAYLLKWRQNTTLTSVAACPVHPRSRIAISTFFSLLSLDFIWFLSFCLDFTEHDIGCTGRSHCLVGLESTTRKNQASDWAVVDWRL